MKNISLVAAALMAAASLPSVHKTTGVGFSASPSRRRYVPDNVEVRKLRAEKSAEIRTWNEAVEAKKLAKKANRRLT